MDASMGDEAQQMKRRSGGPCGLHGIQEHCVTEEASTLDSRIYSRDVHPDDAAGADVQMADFAIAHLAIGQADRITRAFNQGVGIVLQPFVQVRSVGECDGVALAACRVAEAVEDY